MHKRGKQAKHWVSYFIRRPKQQPTLTAPLPGRHTPTHISGSTSLSSKSQDPISQTEKQAEGKSAPPISGRGGSHQKGRRVYLLGRFRFQQQRSVVSPALQNHSGS